MALQSLLGQIRATGPKIPLNYSYVLFHIKVVCWRCFHWKTCIMLSFLQTVRVCWVRMAHARCCMMRSRIGPFTYWPSTFAQNMNWICQTKTLKENGRVWSQPALQDAWCSFAVYMYDCNSMSFFLNTLIPCSWKLEKPKRKKHVILRNKKGHLFIHH